MQPTPQEDVFPEYEIDERLNRPITPITALSPTYNAPDPILSVFAMDSASFQISN